MTIARACFTLILLASCSCLTLTAQNSSKVKKMQAQKKEMQKGIDNKRDELKQTESKVNATLSDINLLLDRINDQQHYLDTLEFQLNKINLQEAELEAKITQNTTELQKKKDDYARALRYERASKHKYSPLLFILSARSITQMLRRARYAHQYASYQRTLADEITEKQNKLMVQKNELLRIKAEKSRLIDECEKQKAILQAQQEQEKKKAANLQQKQKQLKKEIKKQQDLLAALDKKIDDLIAYEIEQARLKAEEEARKKQQQRKKQSKPSSTSKPQADKWLTPQDQELSESFEKNKGRLPVPITGDYMIGSRFGTYNVPGLKNVTLDNKGINYIGRQGAMARCIFNGKVTAVFQFGDTKNVLIRHGSYISVYCNLSSVRVTNGQNINTRDIIGLIKPDGSGHCVLQFQLRKETQKLNPEYWIGK